MTALTLQETDCLSARRYFIDVAMRSLDSDLPARIRRKEYEDYLSDESELRRIFIAEAEGRRVGGLGLSTLPNLTQTMEICMVSVDPPFQSRGYGRAMMMSIEDTARQEGICRLALEPDNGDLVGFYSKLGYEVQTYRFDRHDRTQMVKEIA